jgi:peptidoglycan/xylan/chitin deacetylase (PgdA/CDA1 family)
LIPVSEHPDRRLLVGPVAGLAVVVALLLIGCASSLPRPNDRAAIRPRVAEGSPVPAAIGGSSLAAAPGSSPVAPSQPAPRAVVANWPPAAQSTPDPGFVLHVPILMYHRIVAPADAGAALPGLVIDPTVFSEELDMLHALGWHTITLATLEHDLADDLRPAPRTFVLTIDDGHADGLTNALPILERFGDVATYFVVPGRVHDPGFLDAADLQTLADAGMEIADHTMNHVDVGRLHGLALDFQIGAAAREIEQITGRAPSTFAYPAGESSTAAAAVVEANGMGMAVTTREGVLETWLNRFIVPRLRVSPSLTPAMLVRILSGYAID